MIEFLHSYYDYNIYKSYYSMSPLLGVGQICGMFSNGQ
ncbi:hypothetical protein BACCAC_01877 [Bacteroides caccae ATCC 43185]|nr:hypothetical protein BACCAC_01877 [Bacteroides caccae ATCC 43185]